MKDFIGSTVAVMLKNCTTSVTFVLPKKGPKVTQRSPLQLYNIGEPMEFAIDVLGPLAETNLGKKYILIAKDYFSKCPDAYALPNQETAMMTDVLVSQFFSRSGLPAELHSDQGRNFESRLF